MAIRGSGIGASGVNLGQFATGVGPAQSTGRAVGPSVQTVYGQAGQAAWGAHSVWLLVLVAFEALALICLRQGFRHAHGG